MTTDKSSGTISKLQCLVEEQIDLAKQGNTSELQTVARRAGVLADRIAETNVLALIKFKSQRVRLEKLYKELCLVIASQKADTIEELGKVRKGRRTVKVYHDNMKV